MRLTILSSGCFLGSRNKDKDSYSEKKTTHSTSELRADLYLGWGQTPARYPSIYLLVSLSRVSRLKLLAGFETHVDETNSTSRLMWLASLYNFTYLTEGTRPRKTCSSLLTDLLKMVSNLLIAKCKKAVCNLFFAYFLFSVGVQFDFPSVLAALNLEIGKSASHYLTTREARKPYPQQGSTKLRTRIEALRAAAGPRGTKDLESIDRNWA